MISNELLDILACPACKGKLSANSVEQNLWCHSCERVFPVREGIPVMIEDESATQLK